MVRGGEGKDCAACRAIFPHDGPEWMVAGLAVWAEALPETKLTDEQVPLPLSAPASALPPEQGIIGPDHRHRQRGKSSCPQHHVKPAFQGSLRLVISRSLPAPEWGVHPVDGWTEWTRWTVVDGGGRPRVWCEDAVPGMGLQQSLFAGF